MFSERLSTRSIEDHHQRDVLVKNALRYGSAPYATVGAAVYLPRATIEVPYRAYLHRTLPNPVRATWRELSEIQISL